MSEQRTITVKAEDLSLTYPLSITGEYTVFRDISFQIMQGEKIGFFGPSGSGKTSLFRILLGTQTPSSGTVSLHGIARMVYQIPQLNPWLTCKEILELELLRGTLNLDALTLLESVQLSKEKNQLVVHLSGGEKQRLAFVAAIASGATIVLADEPFGRLDSNNASIARNFILRIVEEHNLTLLLASHQKNHFNGFDRVFKFQDQILKEESTI